MQEGLGSRIIAKGFIEALPSSKILVYLDILLVSFIVQGAVLGF